MEMARKAMSLCCDTDGNDGRLFPPDVPEAEYFLGEQGYKLFHELFSRVHRKVRRQYGPELTPVNYLVSWITGAADGVEDSQTESFEFEKHAHWLEGTYAPHVDKANMPEYDVSALLYLNSATEFVLIWRCHMYRSATRPDWRLLADWCDCRFCKCLS